MSRLGRWLVAALVLLLARGRARHEAAEAPEPPLEAPEHDRIVTATGASPGAELLVLVLLGLGGACAAAFVVVYAVDSLGSQTQLLGLALGLALAFLAAAAVVTGKRLVPQEELQEPYPEGEHPGEPERVERIVDESGTRITRKRLLVVTAGGAGAALGAALVTPAVSLGPILDVGRLRATPWRAGARLVDSLGRELLADAVPDDGFVTAFPQGADREQLGAPLLVVRLDPQRVRLPAERQGWAPGGILAYSKICTHAGCAVALYRTPLYEPTSAEPAFVCPCHYSTFDPATGGTVLFGPAGRPLPQLPLRIAPDGALEAAGGFSGAIGPSWWGVRS